MVGAIAFLLLLGGAFVIGAWFARNRIVANMLAKKMNAVDIQEVTKIWT